jgi:hypothetical protein
VPSGQAQFEVGFYKLVSHAPVSVRTKVRAAPAVARALGDGPGGPTAVLASSSGGGKASSPCISSCFLEVSIENAMREESLLLSSVKFSPLPGVRADDPVAHLADGPAAAAAACASSSSGDAANGRFDPFGSADSGGSGGGAAGVAAAAGKEPRPRGGSQSGSGGAGDADADADGSGSDTEAQHDTARARRASCSSGGGGGAPGAAAAEAPPTPKVLASLTPLLPGGNRHFLWAIHRDLGRAPQPPAPGQPPAAGCLGRLEILWRSADGRSGRLQTQPIAGAAAAGPAAALGAPAGGAGGAGVALELMRLPAAARVDAPFSAALRVRVAAGAEGRAPSGPLLLLHSAPAPGPRASAPGAPPPAQQQAAQRPADAAAAPPPAVAVLGPRVLRLGELAPGGSRDLEIRLLPLRRGWQRLPAFIVVAADGAPCASVHDVSVLVE